MALQLLTLLYQTNSCLNVRGTKCDLVWLRGFLATKVSGGQVLTQIQPLIFCVTMN